MLPNDKIVSFKTQKPAFVTACKTLLAFYFEHDEKALFFARNSNVLC